MSTVSTVKLGLMPPLTGIVGIYGTEIVRAAQIACQEINDNGGVLGRPLEIIVEDDGSLPDTAVVAARKLVEEHKCSAIIGNLLSNSRIAVAYQVAEPENIPLLNFSFYEGSILSQYFFHFAALPNQQIHRMIPYMREKFGPKMFFAGNNYEWPRGSVDAGKIALEEAGGEVVGEEYLPIGLSENEINELLEQVEAANPNVFVPYFAGADQALLLTRFTERGMKEKMAVVMGHYDEMLASTLSANVREGFYSSNTYFMTVDTNENHNYLAQLEKLPDVDGIWPKGNGILTNFGEGTYLCVKAFAQAANEAGIMDSDSLINSLKNISVVSPQGEVQMNSEHHHANVNTYLSLCDENGQFNIVESFGEIKPVLPGRYSHQRISHQATLEEDIRLQARMLEQLTDAVLLISSDNGSILYANAGAEHLFAYDKGDMTGLNLSKINYSDESSLTEQSGEIIKILNKKGRWEGETKNIKSNGDLIWSKTTLSTFTHPIHGEVWLGIYSDISNRKISEEALRHSESRYRRIEQGTKDGFWEWDINSGTNYFSPNWMRMVGYEPNELPATIDTFSDLVHPDDKDRVWDSVDSHIKNGTVFDSEVRIRCKDNSYLWVRSRGEVERDENNLPVIMAGTIVDISERKKHEEELKLHREHLEELVKERTYELEAARDVAEKASRAKNEFLSRMSHELRTPMNAILGFAQVLDMDKLDDRQHQHVNEILMGGKHLLELINELLDLSKIEAGKIEIELHPLKIMPAIEYAIQSVHPIIEKRNITILNNCDDIEVLSDTTRFNQVLINLLSNAAKYNRDDGKIEVASEIVSNNCLRVAVSDTGYGISEDKIEYLFEPFNRLGAESSGIDGTGIGLALTKELVTLMGGEMMVESTVGKGSIFSFELPLANKTSPVC